MQSIVTIVSDDPISRMGLEALVEQVSAVFIGETVDLDGAVDAVRRGEAGQVLVWDTSCGGLDTKRMREALSAAKNATLLAVIGDDQIALSSDLLEAGATGVVTRQASRGMISTAISRLRQGDNYLEPRIAHEVMKEINRMRTKRRARDMLRLTLREEQVARELMTGRTNGQIAKALAISEKTVKHYVGSLKGKFDAANRLEVVLKAQEMDLFGGSAQRA